MNGSVRDVCLLLALGLIALGLSALLVPGEREALRGLAGPQGRPPAEQSQPGDRVRFAASNRRLDGAEAAADSSTDNGPAAEPDTETTYEPVNWSGNDPWKKAPLGPGRQIHGRVIRGREAVPGALVRATREPLTAFESPATWGAEVVTDSDGRFNFGTVEAGDWHIWAVVDGSELRARVRVKDEDRPRRGVLLAFGTSSIAVRVFDDAGNRLKGVPVYCSGIGPAPSRLVQATSDQRGEARLAGLVAGRYHLRADRSAYVPQTPEGMVLVPSAAEVTVDIGFATVPVTWSGRLLDGNGEVVEPGENLRLVHRESGMERWLQVRGASFEASLSAGTWDVHRPGRTFGLGPLVGSATIGSSHLNRDLVFPGTRLILMPVGAEPSQLKGTEMNAIGGSWSNREGGSPEVVSAKALEYFGVPPGRYSLQLEHPWRFAASMPGAKGQMLSIEITGEESVLRLSLAVER